MSADNFYLIRRAGTRYAVSSESASATIDREDPVALARAVALFFTPAPIDSPHLSWFDDEQSALEYASGEYSEYGVTVDTQPDAAHDTRAARLESLMRGIAATTSGVGVVRSNHHDEGAVALHLGDYQIRVAGPTFEDAAALASAIEAVCFPDLDE